MDRRRDIHTHLLSADKNVFNSSVDVLTGLSLERQQLRVFMDETEEVGYSVDELDEITHAYAATVHRSQGDWWRRSQSAEHEALALPPGE